MWPPMDPESEAVKPCATVDDPVTADLTWLMTRATRVLSDEFDELAQREGLADLRDCLVLGVVSDGESRTQLEISRALGIDKTTMVTIIDRLVSQELLVREHSARDRRVRIPVITKRGHEVLDRVLAARDAAVESRLAAFPDDEGAALRLALWRIATSAS